MGLQVGYASVSSIGTQAKREKNYDENDPLSNIQCWNSPTFYNLMEDQLKCWAKLAWCSVTYCQTK